MAKHVRPQRHFKWTCFMVKDTFKAIIVNYGHSAFALLMWMRPFSTWNSGSSAFRCEFIVGLMVFRVCSTTATMFTQTTVNSFIKSSTWKLMQICNMSMIWSRSLVPEVELGPPLRRLLAVNGCSYKMYGNFAWCPIYVGLIWISAPYEPAI